MRSKKNKNIGGARLTFVFIFVSLGWLLLVFRLGEIQLAYGKEYKDKASKQSSGKIKVKSQRGLVFDRKGRQIAVNVIKNSLYAYPSNKKEISRIYRYLDKLYGRKSGVSRQKYSLRRSKFSWLDRSFSDARARRVMRDSIPGLYLKEEMKRDYPFGDVGVQLLGCTDLDGRGISGLEYNFDSVLAGSPGLIDYLRDAHRNTYRIKKIPLIKPTPGNSMILTVDWHFQEIVEKELKLAVEKYNAQEGSAIFIDCHTGDILVAADYSANGASSSVKLKAVSNCFEPGSVFKIFTAAALLDEGLVDADEKIFCENGLWKCERGRLRDDKEHDSLIFQDIFELSSNIGIGKLALRLGHEKLIETAKRFGFGTKTFAGLPGEQSGMIGDPGVWSEYNIAALSIGHSISATPLQLAAAVAAVANGGKLMRPWIVRGIINDDGKLIEKNSPEYIGTVIEDESIEILRNLMIGVVERGTATPAKSELVSIAGKTGTAEIIDYENGGYIKNRFNASFLGFFPAEEPKIAGIVVLNQPRPVTYGGHTAGPAFKNMAERYSIANSEFLKQRTNLLAGNDDLDLKKIPDFTGKELPLALKIAEGKGFELTANDSCGMIVWQYPPEGWKIPGNERVAVLVQSSDDQIRMVDFKGIKMRTAMAVLNQQGLDFEIKGSGTIKKQYPSAGTSLRQNSKCRLVCGSS